MKLRRGNFEYIIGKRGYYLGMKIRDFFTSHLGNDRAKLALYFHNSLEYDIKHIISDICY